jgi:hypothetical protein
MATITVTDLATELNTDARTARKFLRSVTPSEEQPGKGGRWQIEKRDIRSLRSKFSKFAEAETARKAEKAAPVETPEGDDELELEPTAEELAAIDAE